MQASHISSHMRRILLLLQTTQGTVPCTDAARALMRKRLRSMSYYFGLPLLFVTLNPADVLHPYTWRHSLASSSEPVPACALDSHLRATLQSANLWRLVAQDPTAAVEAFHLHVRTFLRDLLDAATSPDNLPPDGVASLSGRGVFDPLLASFGSIEPQQRGSLHIHFVLWLAGFQSPQDLVRRFRDSLPTLERCLWHWVNSILSTSFETIPCMFNLPADLLRNIRPLPYSDDNMQVMHSSYRQHIVDSQDHWFAAAPDRFLLAEGPFLDPATGEIPTTTTFTPWSADYTTTLLTDPSDAAWPKLLLFDLRNTILQSGLLHSCKPKTCSKGKLGKLGYCRLGFHHWLDISSPLQPHTWERCHGMQLVPTPILGTHPPHIDAFLTERHHQYFGRLNPCILTHCKCNHDVSILLRFPANMSPSGPVALHSSPAVSQSRSDCSSLIATKMAANMSVLIFYVTAYTTKVQPQMTSLWALLQAATSRLLHDLQSEAASVDISAAQQAHRTLGRLLMACQKKVHKSMQEMVSYLLGYDDFYSTHASHNLFYSHLAAQLLLHHPIPGMPTAATHLAAMPEVSIQPHLPDSQDIPGPATTWSFLSSDEADYPHRGPDLQDWPLYFYVAGVRSVQASTSRAATPGCIPFAASHPFSRQKRQQVLTQTAWRVPTLFGPAIPTASEDPEKRSMLLLLLFKPWTSLLDLVPHTCNCESWTQAWTLFSQSLQQNLPADNTRAELLTTSYWAQRTLHIIQNIDNLALADLKAHGKEATQNPVQVAGVPGATTAPSTTQLLSHDNDLPEEDDDWAPLHDPDLPEAAPYTQYLPFFLLHIFFQTFLFSLPFLEHPSPCKGLG